MVPSAVSKKIIMSSPVALARVSLIPHPQATCAPPPLRRAANDLNFEEALPSVGKLCSRYRFEVRVRHFISHRN